MGEPGLFSRYLLIEAAFSERAGAWLAGGLDENGTSEILEGIEGDGYREYRFGKRDHFRRPVV